MTTSGVIDTKTGKVRHFGLRELNAREAVIDAAKAETETEYGHPVLAQRCRQERRNAVVALLAAEEDED